MNLIIDFTLNDKTIKTTPFQLIQWKHGLKLESKGLRLSRGRSVSAYLKNAFGLKRNYPRKDLIAAVENKLAEIRQEEFNV